LSKFIAGIPVRVEYPDTKKTAVNAGWLAFDETGPLGRNEAVGLRPAFGSEF
jgi:hypothetical protein